MDFAVVSVGEARLLLLLLYQNHLGDQEKYTKVYVFQVATLEIAKLNKKPNERLGIN
jgi:hypothetical protein